MKGRKSNRALFRLIMLVSYCCLYRAYLSSYCLHTEPTLYTYDTSYLHIQATFRHVAVVATTTTCRKLAWYVMWTQCWFSL